MFKPTYQLRLQEYETGPYLCQSEQSLTLREMVNNYRVGLPVNAKYHSDLDLGTDDEDYDGNDIDYVDIESLDLVEIDELQRQLIERKSILEKRIHEENSSEGNSDQVPAKNEQEPS